MPGPYGIVSTGFNRKPLAQILSDMQAIELAQISANLDLQPPDPIAVLTGLGAAMFDELWQVAAALYGGMDPDVADSDQLTGLSLITGTNRLAATATTVPGCTVNVNTGFSQAPGTMFASLVGNPAALFTNKETVANSSGIAANVTVDFVAVATGPTQVLVSTLTQIAQPISGWNSITNPNAGVTGSDTESDSDLRLRRDEELAAAGSSTAAAIKSAILQKLVMPTTSSNTTTCTVLFNDTDAVDGNGLPPHSIEVIANQASPTSDDDQALVNLIFAEKAAGIGTYSGNATSKTATDSQGNTETIYYTRPTPTQIYCNVTVKVDPKVFIGGTPGKAAVVAALQAYANKEWNPGVEVYYKALQASLFPSPLDVLVGVPGILDITAFTIGFAPSPVGTSNLTIGIRNVATLNMTASTDVTITT